MSILDEIIENRRKKIRKMGHGLGVSVPPSRSAPLVPFGRDPFILCEIKRRSPSKGPIAPYADAKKQAQIYTKKGIKTVSVLTEPDFFSGSLQDLVSVKKAFPGLSVLRKDFLIDEEDIDVSYRAGADALLLIAKLHEPHSLLRLYTRAKRLGMEVLVELHDEEDVKKARTLKPGYTGINSRNLENFQVDPEFSYSLVQHIDWPTRLVFESGISSKEHAARALEQGFCGVLVGEGVMKNASLVNELCSVFSSFRGAFWQKLFSLKQQGKPLTKICGITRPADAEFSAEMGADVLGFIFTDSPRKASFDLPRKTAHLDVLKVGVVTAGGTALFIEEEIAALLSEGLIDAVQFHGEERPETLERFSFPWYKALRLKDETNVERISSYPCPRVLVDAFVPGVPGGTGKTASAELIEKTRLRHPLWLAGGIGPANVKETVTKFRPELLDSSSRLERAPGIKDHRKIEKFFKEIERAQDI